MIESTQEDVPRLYANMMPFYISNLSIPQGVLESIPLWYRGTTVYSTCERSLQVPSTHYSLTYLVWVKSTVAWHRQVIVWELVLSVGLVESFSLVQKSKDDAIPPGYISPENCQHYSLDNSHISRWLLSWINPIFLQY